MLLKKSLIKLKLSPKLTMEVQAFNFHKKVKAMIIRKNNYQLKMINNYFK